ncbi:MAG: hypothetical protein AAFX06_28105 [Planctomycetota bacterium]
MGKQLAITDIDDEQIDWLIAQLAAADALFSPWRVDSGSNEAWLATLERQHAYKTNGLRVAGSGDAAGRKSAERFVGELEAAGWIQTSIQRNARYVRLCGRGDWLIRSIAAAPLLTDGWKAYQRIKSIASVAGRPLVEADVIGINSSSEGYYTQDEFGEFVNLAWDLAALLTHGIVESASDTEGRVGYVVAEEVKRPRKPRGLPDPTDRWAELYLDRLHETRKARARWVPIGVNTVVIPLTPDGWAHKTGEVSGGT